ncbi:MAG: Mur ligase family protein, partial [bacterium]
MEQIKNYKKSLDYLYNLSLFSCKKKLDNITYLLNYLNNPHKNLKFIHIAGTNGKGSTSVFIYQILQQANFKVGLFTSPHLIDFRERIRINEKMISKKDVIRLVSFLEKKIKELHLQPIFFEVITVLSFLYFQEKNVDFVVLETGLGGKLDATNVVNPIISVITSIGFDHTNKLGKTLKEITYE